MTDAIQSADAIEVFFSYAHEDEDLRDELEKHLSTLKRRGVIAGWHDRKVGAGKEWKGEIDANLNTARVILLLISADFIASDYCWDVEVMRAMERHEAGEAQVIPIILRSVDWKDAPFGKLQALPTDATPVTSWADRDKAFLDVAQGIRAAVEELMASKAKDETVQDLAKGFPRLVGVPHRLPSFAPPYWPPKAYHHLIGRFNELDQIMSALRDPKRKPMIAIVGLGGIGKTALAREAVERCWGEKIFDRVVWASSKTEHFIAESTIKTGGSLYSFDELLSDIGRQCDRVEIAQMPADQKQATGKCLLAKKRVLVVMDNLETVPESEHLVASIFQILGKSKLLITSRHHVKHGRMFTLNLGGFPVDEGVTFLREESKERGIKVVSQAGRPSLIEIHQVTGGVPLAMKLVVGQMSRQPMKMVLNTLKQASFKGQDYPFYRFVYQQSWEVLDMDTRMALVDMSVFPPISGGAVEDVQVVSQVETSAFWPAMDQLVTLSLVDKTGPAGRERFALHPLTQYFIQAEITKEWVTVDWGAYARGTASRHVTRYLAYAEAHKQSSAADYDALEAELVNILTAIEHAHSVGDWASLMQLMKTIGDVRAFLDSRGYWDEAVKRWQQAIEAAQRVGDKRAVADFYGKIGMVYYRSGKFTEARQLYQDALEMIRGSGEEDEKSVADLLNQLGRIAYEEGDYIEVQRLHEEALRILRNLGEESSGAETLHRLAILAFDQGRHTDARSLFDESLKIRRKLENKGPLANTLHHLGDVAYVEGNYAEARMLYEESLEIAEVLGDERCIADALHRLGIMAEGEADYSEAGRLYRRSLKIQERIGNRAGVARSLYRLGHLAQNMGCYSEAKELYEKSLEIMRELNIQRGIAEVQNALGKLATIVGDYERARTLLVESLSVAHQLGHPLRIGYTTWGLSVLEEKVGNIEQALELIRQTEEVFERLGVPQAEQARSYREHIELLA